MVRIAIGCAAFLVASVVLADLPDKDTEAQPLPMIAVGTQLYVLIGPVEGPHPPYWVTSLIDGGRSFHVGPRTRGPRAQRYRVFGADDSSCVVTSRFTAEVAFGLQTENGIVIADQHRQRAAILPSCRSVPHPARVASEPVASQ